MSVPALTELFSKLGAPHPAEWARSQTAEGIPQLARFLFLRQAWKHVVADSTWIKAAEDVDPAGPGREIAPALRRVRSLGVSDRDLTSIVRVMQWRLLFDFCYLLDDPGERELEVKDIAWRLFQIDTDGRPIAAVSGLHESVLEVEPPGREMQSAQAHSS